MSVYEQYLDDLYNESPKAAYALESMKFSVMAYTDLGERDALELVCKIMALEVKTA